MKPSSPVTLRLTTPEGAVRDVLLDEEMLVLGSGPAAGLRVHDPAVSSLHLLLKRHHDTVLAINLASEAGTQVGDTPLQAPRALRHEEVVRLGRSRLTLYFGAAPGIAPHGPGHPGLPRHETFGPRGGSPSPAPRVHGAAALAIDPAPIARVLPVRHASIPRAETSAWKLLLGPLPAALAPTEKHRVLQAALVWEISCSGSSTWRMASRSWWGRTGRNRPSRSSTTVSAGPSSWHGWSADSSG